MLLSAPQGEPERTRFPVSQPMRAHQHGAGSRGAQPGLHRLGLVWLTLARAAVPTVQPWLNAGGFQRLGQALHMRGVLVVVAQEHVERTPWRCRPAWAGSGRLRAGVLAGRSRTCCLLPDACAASSPSPTPAADQPAVPSPRTAESATQPPRAADCVSRNLPRKVD